MSPEIQTRKSGFRTNIIWSVQNLDSRVRIFKLFQSPWYYFFTVVCVVANCYFQKFETEKSWALSFMIGIFAFTLSTWKFWENHVTPTCKKLTLTCKIKLRFCSTTDMWNWPVLVLRFSAFRVVTYPDAAALIFTETQLRQDQMGIQWFRLLELGTSKCPAPLECNRERLSDPHRL